MKKIAPLLLLMLMSVGCAKTEYSPVIPTGFELNAVYTTGDFSYSCTITRADGVVTITPTGTYAAGMTMTCDGSSVTFDYDGMRDSIGIDDAAPANPAALLYDVFDCVCGNTGCDVVRVDDHYQYSGATRLGDFTLVQGDDDRFSTIVIPDADITITISD